MEVVRAAEHWVSMLKIDSAWRSSGPDDVESHVEILRFHLPLFTRADFDTKTSLQEMEHFELIFSRCEHR